MGITFKKNGRPSKAEKGLVKNINNFLSSLDEAEKEKYNFDKETVTNPNRLQEIWDSVVANPEEKKEDKIELEVDGEHLNVDKSTGEILEDEEIKEEHINFVNNSEPMDDAIIENEESDVLKDLTEGDGAENIEEVPSFFNPLKDPKKKRSYQATSQTDVGEIEEPDFANKQTAQETLDELEEEKAFAEEGSAYDSEEDEEQEPSAWDNLKNEGMEELDNKDKKFAAKQLVQTVLDGYEMLHELGKNFVKYPEDKIQEKIIKQEIDPTMTIPLDELGNTTNVVEFFSEFNSQAEEAISYDPEFGEKVRPAMERVFAKKGWGMTDEQFLMVAFGKDIAWKSVQIFTLKKTAKGIMNTFEQLQQQKIEAIRQSNARPIREESLEADSITTPPKQEQPPVQNNSDVVVEVDEEEEANNGYYNEGSDASQDTDIVPIHQ